jgi:hypothetical protein
VTSFNRLTSISNAGDGDEREERGYDQVKAHWNLRNSFI